MYIVVTFVNLIPVNKGLNIFCSAFARQGSLYFNHPSKSSLDQCDGGFQFSTSFTSLMISLYLLTILVINLFYQGFLDNLGEVFLEQFGLFQIFLMISLLSLMTLLEYFLVILICYWC